MLKRDIFTTLTGEVARLFLGTVSTVVLARGLGPDARGVYALVVWLPTTLVVFVAFGQQYANSVFAGLYKSARFTLFVQSVIVSAIGTLLGILAITVYFRLHPSPWGTLHAPIGAWVLSLVLLPVLLLDGVFRELARGCEYIRKVAVVGVGVILLQAVGFLSWHMLVGLTVQSAVTILILSYLASSLAYLRLLSGATMAGDSAWSPAVAKESWKFGTVVALGMGGSILVNQGATFLLPQFKASAREVGLFAVALVFAQQLGAIPNAVAQAFLPRLSNNPGERISQTPLIFRVTMVACVGTMISLLVASVPVVTVLLGAEYWGSIPLLSALLPGVTVFGASRVLGSYLWVTRKPKYGLVASWAAALLLVVLCSILIPRAGGLGAALATSAALGLTAACTVWAFCRESGVPLADLVPKRSDVMLLVTQAANILRRLGEEVVRGRFDRRLAVAGSHSEPSPLRESVQGAAGDPRSCVNVRQPQPRLGCPSKRA